MSGRAVAMALLLALIGCQQPEAARVEPTAKTSTPVDVRPPSSEPDTTPLPERCIRGGTPRANVARIMGEPDSVVYGSWFYGESEVLFGYGVVVEIRDRGELILCDPA